MESIGGMQRVSVQLVKELQNRDDIELKTIILSSPWKGIELRAFIFLFKLIFTLPGKVRKHKPDVILFSSMVSAYLVMFVRSRIKVPMVTINHGQDVTNPSDYYQKKVPEIFNRLNGVISVSRATRDECIKRGMSPEKGVALPNGFDMSDFEHEPNKKEAQKKIDELFELNLQGKKLLLTVGRQVKRKGHAWFLEEVLPKINSDVFYLIIGEGLEHENLVQIVESHPKKEFIKLVGKQSDEVLKSAYEAADIFIMPNIPVEGDMEGFGIVLLEANLAGTPAIASDLEGIKDVIEDGMNGFKIHVRDSDRFAQQVDNLIENGLDEMAKSSRKFVLEKFTWQNVAEQYISYLSSVIKSTNY